MLKSDLYKNCFYAIALCISTILLGMEQDAKKRKYAEIISNFACGNEDINGEEIVKQLEEAGVLDQLPGITNPKVFTPEERFFILQSSPLLRKEFEQSKVIISENDEVLESGKVVSYKETYRRFFPKPKAQKIQKLCNDKGK